MDTHGDVGNDQATSRNPPWVRDELILALDLYFRLRPKIGDYSHPDVIELSEFLNALPIHRKRPDAERFRNPAGVAMKLNNFRGLDPEYPGTGLSHGSKGDKDAWDEFAHDAKRLQAVADAIRAYGTSMEAASPVPDDEETTAAEGELLLRQHRQRERDRSITGKKKEHVLKRDGVLRCEACGFAFSDLYGELGAGFIECHHTIPLAQLRPGQVTRLQDLALVCANCHRMLHVGGQVRSIAVLQEAIRFAHVAV